MTTTLRNKIEESFEIQHTLNTSILGDYVNKSVPFYRAAIVEAVELMEHRGYKWWKSQDSYDEAQAQMEIVDIWHFLMSTILSDGEYTNDTAFIEKTVQRAQNKKTKITKESQLLSIDDFIKYMSGDIVENYVFAFAEMMYQFNMTFDDLYKMYIAKNALNYFRQNNGYKEGTYNKEDWVSIQGDFVEDNVVLAEILEMGCTSLNVIYEALRSRYPG